MMKYHTSMMGLGGASFKRRYVLILPSKLIYCESEFTLETSRATLLKGQATSVVSGTDKGQAIITVTGPTAKENLVFAWVEGEDIATQRIWMTKLSDFVVEAKGGSRVSMKKDGAGTVGAAGGSRKRSVFG